MHYLEIDLYRIHHGLASFRKPGIVRTGLLADIYAACLRILGKIDRNASPSHPRPAARGYCCRTHIAVAPNSKCAFKFEVQRALR